MRFPFFIIANLICLTVAFSSFVLYSSFIDFFPWRSDKSAGLAIIAIPLYLFPTALTLGFIKSRLLRKNKEISVYYRIDCIITSVLILFPTIINLNGALWGLWIGTIFTLTAFLLLSYSTFFLLRHKNMFTKMQVRVME